MKEGRDVKIVFAVIIATTTAILSVSAQELRIMRRSPACVVQADVDAFYDLMRGQPRMQDIADFLRAHQCISLKSGDRVTIEEKGLDQLHYCVRIPDQDHCYWVPRSALKR
jgi:hypothetical protein